MGDSYPLTDDEALLLDGKVSAKAQALVNLAKARVALRESGNPDLSENDLRFIVAAVEEARRQGLLHKRHVSMRHCSCCGQDAGYAVYARSSRNHRKGDRNLDKPRYFSGVSLADDFISITGYPRLSACKACYERLIPYLRSALRPVSAELPEELQGDSHWVRHKLRTCGKCQWEGLESEMGQQPTLFGGGTYPAVCPQCKAENRVFHPEVIKLTGAHRMLTAKAEDSLQLAANVP